MARISNYRVLISGIVSPLAALLLYALVYATLTAASADREKDWLFRLSLSILAMTVPFLVTAASMRFPYLRKQVWPSQFSHSASLGNPLTTASSARSSPEIRRYAMWPRPFLTPWTFSENVSAWKTTRAR